jgi:hypothetical protein
MRCQQILSSFDRLVGGRVDPVFEEEGDIARWFEKNEGVPIEAP